MRRGIEKRHITIPSEVAERLDDAAEKIGQHAEHPGRGTIGEVISKLVMAPEPAGLPAAEQTREESREESEETMRDPAAKLTIGGSDLGALYGVDPRRDQFSLWAEKKDGLPREEPTTRMFMGKALESALCSVFNHQTGLKAEWCDRTTIDPRRPFMSYTPDALIPSCNWGVDIKVVAYDQRFRWGRTAADIPLSIQLQAAWYMAAFESDAWIIAAYVAGDTDNDPLRIYEIRRDLDLETAILRKAENFWRRYLIGDERPPLSTSPHAKAWLTRRFPVNRPDPPRRATSEEAHLLDLYADVRRDRAAVNERFEHIENNLKELCREDSGIQSADHLFTWKKTADGEVIDWQSMAIGLLTYHIKDPADRDKLYEQHTHPKKGHRVVYFKNKTAV